jgi:hypothetical protein
MSLNYIHQINGNQIEITSKEIGEIKNSIIIGLEKNYLQFNKGNFEKIVEIKIKINERKNTFISNLSAYTYSIIPHYLTLELEYVLIIRNKDGEEIKSNVFKSESLGINSIMLFPVSIIYDPRKVLSNYLINVTDLLINYKE